MKYVPSLDKNFTPLILKFREFEKKVEKAENQDLTICLERHLGYNYIRTVKIFKDNTGHDEENYEMLRTKYRNEQIQLTEQISQYEEKLTATKTTEENVRKWVDLISKYSEINELTAPLLNELIEKIRVHEKRIDADGKPTRDIEIYYRFVGRID